MAKSLDIIDPKREMAPPEPQRDDREDRNNDERPERERSGGGVFYLVLGIIAVVVSTALAVYILFNDSKTDDKTATTPTATVSLTESASATVSPTTSTIASQSPSTTALVGTFKYTDESIRIVNGNGKNGEATRIKTILETAGFKIASTGNASKQYAQTTILYKAGQEALANALKSAIAADYTAIIEQSDTTTLGSYDAVIALGAK